MIDNVFVQCNYCKTKIRLRFQIGYFNIPFDSCCPKCGVHIHGIKKLKNKHSTTINNATLIDCKIDEADYYADFSVEFPHTKITKYETEEKILKYGFGPFLMSSQLYGNEQYIELLNHIKCFLSFRESYWPQLTPLFDLYFNGNFVLAKEHFLKISPCFVVENELDALMALHQTTILGMNSILEKGSLEKFISISKQIVAIPHLSQIDDLYFALGGNAYFSSVLSKIMKIYSRWIINFEKYIPATMLALGNAADKFDKETFGIATTSFEDMIDFYSDSYELILDIISVAIGLNNIVIRGDYNCFTDNAIKVNKTTRGVQSFSDYLGIVKSSRLELLIEDEPFGKVIPLNRNVRNSIAHFDYEFNASTQKILFKDKYKSKDNTKEMYLIDLALLCYENMMILVYLDELLYTIQKVQYTKEGLFPHIKSTS